MAVSTDNQRRRHKKRPVMAGQTDQERRELRSQYRHLQKTIADKSEEMEDPNAQAFQDLRDSNNDLFQQVRFTREAVLDGDNLEMLSNKAQTQIDKMLQVPRYDPIRLQQSIRSHFLSGGSNNKQFDWKSLGLQAGACFNALPPRVVFLAGPLQQDYQPKERKQRRKKQDESDDEVEEEEPENVVKQSKTADQLSAVERNIKDLSKVLKKKCNESQKRQFAEIQEEYQDDEEGCDQAMKRLKQEGRSGEIDGVHYLFNPKSFTQTVENIFHFSFMLKNNQASMNVHDDADAEKENAGLKVAFNPKSKDGSVVPPKQTITTLNMRDWRRLCQAYNVKQGYIPHRTGSKQKKAAAASQEEEEEE